MGHKHRSHPIIIAGNPMGQSKPYTEMTEKELKDRIYELEYRRVMMQKNKNPHIQRVLMEERLTQEINILRIKLEEKEKERGESKGKP